MIEELLQYIWRVQLFTKKELTTKCGKRLKILHKGRHNRDAGPDFLDATIQIENLKVHGAIEIHAKSSNWYEHNHDKDPAYKNVILHVVWQENRDIYIGKRKVPTLVLSNFVEHRLLTQYSTWMQAKEAVPCSAHLGLVANANWEQMIEKGVIHRLKKKCHDIQELFKEYEEDSESTAYALLGQSFGFKVNGNAFLALCKSLPFALVLRYAKDLSILEALLLGQAGFLHALKSRNTYVQGLCRTYKWLQNKHKLPLGLEKSQWKFARLHPANSPTLRIVQFAQLLYRVLAEESVFCYFMNTSLETLCTVLRIAPSEYWQRHYHFTKKSKSRIPAMGQQSAHGIIINMVVPLCSTYGRVREENFYMERAMDFLKKLPAEENHITRLWRKLGRPIKNAFDSQGAISLLHDFCVKKQCLSCVVGQGILQHGSLQQRQDRKQAIL